MRELVSILYYKPHPPGSMHPFDDDREEEPYHLSDDDRELLHKIISNLQDKISFKNLLFKYIDETGMTDAQVYSAAGISKQVFSYIRNDKILSLKKENVVSLCIVLKLNEEKTLKLLESCGYYLSENNTFDRFGKSMGT